MYLKQLGDFGSHPSPFYNLTAFHKEKFPFFCFLILGGFFISISFLVLFQPIGSVQTEGKTGLIKKSDSENQIWRDYIVVGIWKELLENGVVEVIIKGSDANTLHSLMSK